MRISQTSDLVKYVMNVILRKDEWETVFPEDIEGAIGIALVLAYMDGIKPELKLMAKFLNADPESLRVPFYRLLNSGIFSKEFNAREDKDLKRQDQSPLSKCAWSSIGGIAAGLIYRSY